MGSLQWPAVQSSPHLQASTSMLSGEATKGLVGTAVEANRLLKFAKENSDVGLCFAPLGPLEQLRMITAFDASFCSRSDGSSQGGYFVMLANNSVLESGEGPYHILDWKSSRLPRVARSSLSAEAQAAGCASDATEFACRYFEHLRFPDWSLAELLQAKSVLNPVMITDAKALYDSYHRRSSLEIRVVKEQIGSLGVAPCDGCQVTGSWLMDLQSQARGKRWPTNCATQRSSSCTTLGMWPQRKRLGKSDRESWNLQRRHEHTPRMSRSQRMTSSLRSMRPLRMT